MSADEEALRAGLRRGGIAHELADAVAAYGALLLDANRHVNLTGAKSAEDVLPHLLDSLTVVPYVDGSLVDVGSGGGLPAIPVALATGVDLTLIETTRKKARFLEHALAMLGLPGRVIAERAEVAGHNPDLRDRFAVGTARAVSSGPTVAELLLPLLAPGGSAVLQRGGMEDRERDAVADAALMLGARLEREVALDGDRRILILRKTASTPLRFPRRTGIPEKRPLCL